MAKVGSIVLFSLFSLALVGAARAQQGNGKFPWDEYEKRIGQAREVAMLKEDLMGDEVNLSNGALSFSATDVSIPGSNALAVGFTRRYSVQNQYERITDLMLGDWDLDVPHITGTFAPDWLTTSTTAPTARCSASDLDMRPPTPVWDFPYFNFWSGNTISIPGGAGGELLRPVAGVDMPTTGGPYRWITPGFSYVSCLPTIKNGSGEGFLAIAPDGTRYWFDWMAQYFEPKAASENTGGQYTINRRRNFLYATKVEDRWGNTVEYQYSNAWNAPGRLTSISASDGRMLSIAYNPNGQIASVSDGTRSWQYQYASVAGRRSLSTVVLPDASRWNIDFRALTSAEITYVPGSQQEPARDCFMRFFAPVGPTQVVGSIQHPSGAYGSFQVQWMTHGRSNVPVACQGFNWGSSGTDTNDDVNQWPMFYEIYSLVSKTISGAAMQTGQWSYAYEPHISFDFYPGGSMRQPCPMGVTCGEPICSSESCARSSRTTITGPDGRLLRYSHGNSFRYNEGKLLRVEKGRVGEVPMSVQINTYDLSQTQQAYPPRFGLSLRENSDGFTSEYHRPMQSSSTIQQGRIFSMANEQFDKFARPTRVTRSSDPAP